MVKSNNRRIAVAFETLGCKLNQAETELLSRQLTESGCEIVSGGEKADIYILNTCTVTHIADRKSRHLIRMAHRRNPDAKIIVLGCYADSAGSELSKIEGINLILTNKEKPALKQILESANYFKNAEPGVKSAIVNRTRSFIKAQDGCNNFCSYCIVPFVRGQENSLPPDQVIQEIQSRVREGYQEVVLTGTEIGRYQHSDTDLNGLLKLILSNTAIRRLRLSSLQPQEITGDLINLWQNPRLCRHFHISLQSGSDTVLGRMARRYNTEDYAAAIRFIRSIMPEVAVTTDIIVGFPGETEKEFLESYEFCRQMEFARTHVFPFSPRKGTRAAEMSAQISPSIKSQRSKIMLELAQTSLRDYQRHFLGKSHEVLFEQCEKGNYSGYTDTYVKVYAESMMDLTNKLCPVRLLDFKNDGLCGEVINQI